MSMLTRKTESSNCCARSALSPSATRIETIAISSGTSPATTAPKTRRRMMSAAGSPNLSSPFSRSSWERRLKSWSSVSVPVTETANAPSSSIASTFSTSASVSSSSMSATGTIVAWRSSETSPASGSSRYVLTRPRAPYLAVVDELAHIRLELRRVHRVLLRADDDDVADRGRRIRGKAASRTSSARSDSGLFVGEPSVVRLPPRSVAIAATARTATMIQAPIVRHAWRALAAARDLVEIVMRRRPTSSLAHR